ncbi:hypothetical protein ACJX0J_011178 [Zea mays]
MHNLEEGATEKRILTLKRATHFLSLRHYVWLILGQLGCFCEFWILQELLWINKDGVVIGGLQCHLLKESIILILFIGL